MHRKTSPHMLPFVLNCHQRSTVSYPLLERTITTWNAKVALLLSHSLHSSLSFSPSLSPPLSLTLSLCLLPCPLADCNPPSRVCIAPLLRRVSTSFSSRRSSEHKAEQATHISRNSSTNVRPSSVPAHYGRVHHYVAGGPAG